MKRIIPLLLAVTMILGMTLTATASIGSVSIYGFYNYPDFIEYCTYNTAQALFNSSTHFYYYPKNAFNFHVTARSAPKTNLTGVVDRRNVPINQLLYNGIDIYPLSYHTSGSQGVVIPSQLDYDYILVGDSRNGSNGNLTLLIYFMKNDMGTYNPSTLSFTPPAGVSTAYAPAIIFRRDETALTTSPAETTPPINPNPNPNNPECTCGFSGSPCSCNGGASGCGCNSNSGGCNCPPATQDPCTCDSHSSASCSCSSGSCECPPEETDPTDRPPDPPKPPEVPASDPDKVPWDGNRMTWLYHYLSNVIGVSTNVGLVMFAMILAVYVIIRIIKTFESTSSGGGSE